MGGCLGKGKKGRRGAGATPGSKKKMRVRKKKAKASTALSESTKHSSAGESRSTPKTQSTSGKTSAAKKTSRLLSSTGSLSSSNDSPGPMLQKPKFALVLKPDGVRATPTATAQEPEAENLVELVQAETSQRQAMTEDVVMASCYNISALSNDSAKWVPTINAVVGGRFKLLNQVGFGTYGFVYEAEDLGVKGTASVKARGRVAVKVERHEDNERMLLRLEAYILRRLTCAGKRSMPELVAVGTKPASFIAMSLLGPNISTMRKQQPSGRMKMKWSILAARGMVTALRDLHDIGFIHRDVKPANFTLGQGPVGRVEEVGVFLLDFGLARRYALPDGTHRPPRKRAGFRGTRVYASINALFLREQSRRDDLAALFYLLLELLRGPLPWRHFREPLEFRTAKLLYPADDLLVGLPHRLHRLYAYIAGLSYYQAPDYSRILALLTTHPLRSLSEPTQTQTH